MYGYCQAFFGLRTCQPVRMDEVALFFDKGLRGSIENMVICGGPSYGTYGGDFLLYPFDLVVWVYTRQKWLPLMLLWSRRLNLGRYKTTSYVTVTSVLSGFKYRYDMVRDVLFDICRRAEISAKKEAPVNFLTDPLDGRSTLRRVDILDELEGNTRVFI
ncbi:hypothetical protein Tco_1306344 [Tanacetum coccineum]